MFKTFLKITYRHIWRTKLYAFINISGLAIGMACVLLATIYMANEQSFDQFHKRNPHLYRITTRSVDQVKTTVSGGTGQVQGPAFKSQIPEILDYTRIMGGDIYGDVRHAEKVFSLQLLFVDSSFLNVFTFKLLEGNPVAALQEINSVVITEKTARKLFNRIDVIGQILQMDADPSAKRLGKPLIIAGVVEDPPTNSSIQFDILFPFVFLQISFEDTNWLNAYLGTFVVLDPKAKLEAVTRKFNHIAHVASKEQLASYYKENGSKPAITYNLQPITDIHLNPQEITNQNREAGVINGSKPIYSIVFLLVACFILLMASINFINISIAASIKRAKEIGIRKVTGSKRSEIFFQFTGESAFISTAAFFFALILLILSLPAFNELTGKQIRWQTIFQRELLGWFTVIFILNTLLSGVYPAFLLSGFNPVQVLYRKQQLTGRHLSGRLLVVFQFVTSIVLGIASMVFYEQMHFIHSKNLGYNPDEVIKIDINGMRDAHQIRENFESELKNNRYVKQLSLTGDFGVRETKVQDIEFQSRYQTVDESYIKLLEMTITGGRNFSSMFQSDKKHAVLVNEAFVKAAHLQDPVGKQIEADSHFGNESFTIVGVVQNFHFSSLRERIQPLVMPMSSQYGGGSLLIKTDRKNRRRAVSDIRAIFQKLLPDAAFNYAFLEDLNAKEYAQEELWQRIIGYATAISVFICCLGLFGLSHLSMFQRRKETGIRLVLGATSAEVIALFSRDFVKIILVAFLVACPIGYYLTNNWLAGFAYHIAFPWWIFLVSGIAVLFTTLSTVGILGARAAAVNPVYSLRSE